ncbi:MAG: fimbria/pilus outer membrane usher protein [Citrobacter amalonaticus]|nr:fimbria/pilus outer membrane usher protein [Citrobacter amalonaticus]
MKIKIILSLIMFLYSSVSLSKNYQFNADFLELSDKKNTDLNRFSDSEGDYTVPGTYEMTVTVNKTELSAFPVTIYPWGTKEEKSRICLNKELVESIGLKEEYLRNSLWWHNDECLDESSLPGTMIKNDPGASRLTLTVPQAYLEYISEHWTPPSRWDNGIPGILFDYNMLFQGRQQKGKGEEFSVYGNGTAGVNISDWRFRGDWQGNITNQKSYGRNSNEQLSWERLYAWKAITSLKSRLTLGEDYLTSGLFDGFRYLGVNIHTDENMLPPGLRGYAPEVTGIARTAARVVISQQGRILYETQVPAGPFRIQDLDTSVSGQLDVLVEEQDGSIQKFKINTATVPYLTRPGALRYSMASGQPVDFRHRGQGPVFLSAEFSRGITNGWSLYGGGLISEPYGALSLGIGRDLSFLGAISVDVTQSRVITTDHKSDGRSYRVSYSKNFDELDSQITFAGYRFSDKNYMTMSDWLELRYNDIHPGRSREMYSVTFNRQLREYNMGLWLNYDQRNFWDRPSTHRYSATLSKELNIGTWRDLSLSLSASQQQDVWGKDRSLYLSITGPLAERSRITYNAAAGSDGTEHRVGYYKRLSDRDNWQMSVGHSRSGANVNTFYNHRDDSFDTNINAAWQANRFASLSAGIQGGMTLTSEGGDFHRAGVRGGARLLIDTSGVPGVPVKSYGNVVRSNRFGKVVLADVSTYFPSRASVVVDELSDDAEAIHAVVRSTLTEGAIGYRRFDIISGFKAMATIRLADGSYPPFGAAVLNMRDQETGIVGDNGSVFLSGISNGGEMRVRWDGVVKCNMHFPSLLSREKLAQTLLLPCN